MLPTVPPSPTCNVPLVIVMAARPAALPTALLLVRISVPDPSFLNAPSPLIGPDKVFVLACVSKLTPPAPVMENVLGTGSSKEEVKRNVPLLPPMTPAPRLAREPTDNVPLGLMSNLPLKAELFPVSVTVPTATVAPLTLTVPLPLMLPPNVNESRRNLSSPSASTCTAPSMLPVDVGCPDTTPVPPICRRVPLTTVPPVKVLVPCSISAPAPDPAKVPVLSSEPLPLMSPVRIVWTLTPVILAIRLPLLTMFPVAVR